MITLQTTETETRNDPPRYLSHSHNGNANGNGVGTGTASDISPPSLFHSVAIVCVWMCRCVCVCVWSLSAFKNLGQSSEHKQNLDDDGYLTMLNNKWVDTYTYIRTHTHTYMQCVSLDICVRVWVARAWVLVWVWVLWNNEHDCGREKERRHRE